MDPYLKIVKIKRHFGTTGNTTPQQATSSLSKSAGKLLFDTNLKIVKKTDKQANDAKSRSNAEVVTLINSFSPDKAFAILEAFEKTYGNIETADFTKKQDAYLTAKVKWYEEHHLAPEHKVRTATDGRREAYWSFPELPEAMKKAYAVDLRPYSFDYYEVKVTTNMGAERSVKSRIYKCLKADVQSISADIKGKAAKIISKYDFKTREVKPREDQAVPKYDTKVNSADNSN